MACPRRGCGGVALVAHGYEVGRVDAAQGIVRRQPHGERKSGNGFGGSYKHGGLGFRRRKGILIICSYFETRGVDPGLTIRTPRRGGVGRVMVVAARALERLWL